ncbi:sensor histidine kinase [Geoalkalibacter halelectricus]|uniref:histidine kinase n=1 Tax=Geoalkalibacter halelectricus TaxID=2847045 RepID=A0ABY5ZN94_9BACT|nr:ATP-binding protein [Geoalkalibacter halelectricus]MDO3379920.1 ATP-binding protein [Geoalkalibacter halelectricus]UWZ80553.1 ATP-binding protein [Geoalkalibacter halelectricus]
MESIEGCPNLADGDEELLFNKKKRLMERCFECPRFYEDLLQLRHQGELSAELLGVALESLRDLRLQRQELRGELEVRNREFEFLHEVTSTIQSSLNLDEIIAWALTAITAGQGFGFNRAILLLVDAPRQNLNGYVAVGPRRLEDAQRIWHEIEEKHYSLQEMAQRFFTEKMPAEKEKFRDLLDLLSLPLAKNNHLFIDTLNNSASRHIHNLWQEPQIDRHQVEALEVSEIVLVPLKSHKRRVGLLLADNIVNRRPISRHDLRLLETFARPLAFAIERGALHEQLQKELGKVRDAHQRLQQQQEEMVRMEKMALVGKIVSHFSHSIRNPLMIIGGFARSLSRQIPEGDERRRYIESIVRETRKLEDVLQEALNYSEALHPTFDLWDINQLLTTVYGGLLEDMDLGGVAAHFDLSVGLPLARIDFKQMSYCLRSLFNNALEAMPQGGKLTISTRASDTHLMIEIRDSGPGIAPEILDQVESPFATNNGKTTGLGLSLCSRILRGHGGTFSLANSEQGGAVVTLSLPLQ